MKYGISYVDFWKGGWHSERVVLGEEFASYKNAEAYVDEEMRSYAREHTPDDGRRGICTDYATMTCRDIDRAEGRDWSIFQIAEEEKDPGQANQGPGKR